MRKILGLAVGLALCVLPASAFAQGKLEGSWSGGGTVKHEKGAERVKCQVSYSHASGPVYNVSASCATTDGTYNQGGEVTDIGNNRFRGRVYSSQHNTTGNVTITLHGNSQSVSVTSDKGSASLTLSRR